MSGWWPWSEQPPIDPATEPVELTAAGMNVLWQARVDQVHAIVGDALRKHAGNRQLVDVLLDVQLALAPPKPVLPHESDR